MTVAPLIPSLLPLFVVAAMKRAEKRIYRQLFEAHALSAESGIALSVPRSVDRRRLEGLIGAGAVRLNANGLHFLDVDGWGEFQRNRRRRVKIALIVVAALIGIGLAVLYFTV